MTSEMPSPSPWNRLARLVIIVVSAAIGLFALLILPDIWRLAPWPVRGRPVESAAFMLTFAFVVLSRMARAQSQTTPRAARIQRGLTQLDRVAAQVLARGLPIGLALGCAALFLSWAPHYVTWPWCRDEDTFACLALDWGRGVLPYRDIRAYNFPGHIYLHWLLGKCFGRGRTVPFYALDAMAVAGLGLALAAWSRRRFASILPGLAGYLAFLSFYLGLEFEQVAERDWHSTLLMVLGILAAESWPGRRGRLIAATTAALALVIRPHAVLFLPAQLSAVHDGREPETSSARAVAEWSVALGAGLILAFMPVMLAGVADDLVRGLRIASYGGPYSRATPASAIQTLANSLSSPWTVATLGSCALLWRLGPPSEQSVARTWLFAMLGALAYRPLHPVQHAYLAHPLELVQSITVAVPAAWLLATNRIAKPIRTIILLLLYYEAMPVIPRYCSPNDSLAAIGPLVRGEAPPIPPLGSERFFHRGPGCHDVYCWQDYTAALNELKRSTPPGTDVANLLRQPPFPPMNGPTGRPSPFRAESGICWLWLVNEDLDATFARALRATPNAVVVWAPAETPAGSRLHLPELIAVVRRDFEPASRFGHIEIWRRRTTDANRRPRSKARAPGSPADRSRSDRAETTNEMAPGHSRAG